MGGLTTDPKDPRLGRGEPNPDGTENQNEVYLVLSEEERAKGFVRPLRRSYRHVGAEGPRYPLVKLDPEDPDDAVKIERGYVFFEPYPESERPSLGRNWKQSDLDNVGNGCGVVTRMGLELCETYAREPHFYGATYCVGCRKHLPVGEFVWDEDNERVGS